MPDKDGRPVIDDEETLLRYMHYNGRQREVYAGSMSGDWVLTHSGDLPPYRAVSPALIRHLVSNKKLFPKYDDVDGYLWDQPRTVVAAESKKRREREGKNAPLVYRDARTGDVYEA
jgi:NAD(P)H-dependent flavin oxidoreductase YrpB (nitropropane dioxygenase family)